MPRQKKDFKSPETIFPAVLNRTMTTIKVKINNINPEVYLILYLLFIGIQSAVFNILSL